MSIVNGYGTYRKYSYGTDTVTASLDRKKYAENAKKAEKDSGVASDVKLSENAKKLLAELKETYGNMDFFVADYSSDEEAQSYLSRGTKEYSVLIDPATLEEMAASKESKEKYLGILDEATGKLSEIQKELSSDEENTISRIGISIDKDGKVSYFAELEKMGEKQKERIEKQKEKSLAEKAEAKRRERNEEKERVRNANRERQPHIPKVTKKVSVKSDSAEGLLEQIRSVDWSQVKAESRMDKGVKFDFSV